MLPNILSNIEQVIRDLNLINEQQLQILLNILGRLHLDDYLYPGVIKRQLQVDSVMAYKLLSVIEQQGFIKACFEIVCFACNKTTGEIYDSIAEIPSEIYCPCCERELNAMENAVLIFRVVVDDRVF